MPKIMSLEALEQFRMEVRSQVDIREKGEQIEKMTVICIGMEECGIAAGAKEIMHYLAEEVAKRHLNNVVVIQGECMGYCDKEPTIEVKLPGEKAVIYTCVTKKRALEILEKHVLGGEMIEGVIPAGYKSLDE